MPTFKVRITAELDITVTVTAADEDHAEDAAAVAAEEAELVGAGAER